MRRFLVVVGLVAAACQGGETADQVVARIGQESHIARTEIDQLTAGWERWIAASDIDSMASLMAEDARTLPPNQPAITGRAAWITWARPMFAHGSWTQDIITESVIANGPIAVERGQYILNFTPGPNSPAGAVAMSDTGKYLWHWHRAEGGWQLATAIWNSDRPSP